ncbi:MAG TPA: 4-hydroxythreonine-4-phosphate dehydrogenase PdxA, partial [Burkholderiales bacterium]|nr:4-hydroxythreonine-4-phosphate dehydrogenase PdxA [Burkholderiales bacterium]
MARRIAIAIGDPNGIGPEIAVKAAAAAPGASVEPVLVGDEFIIREYAARFAPSAALRIAPVDALERAAFVPGACDARAGRATVEYVRAAVAMAGRGEVDAIVACPQSETAINSAGIPFSGYAGLLADLTGTPRGKVFLMLVAAGLRIAHVTLHESVQAALGR